MNIKETIKNLALDAVLLAEKEFVQSRAGQEKKEYAVNLVIDMLPIPFFLKPFKGLMVKYLLKIIDEAIEDTVVKLNTLLKK